VLLPQASSLTIFGTPKVSLKSDDDSPTAESDDYVRSTE
jgi:hypothetical protein